MAGHCRVPSHQSIPSLFFNITQYWLYQCKLRIVPVNLPWCAWTVPESARCWQHRADAGSVLAYCGILTGLSCFRMLCGVVLMLCFLRCTASPVSTATECRNKNVIETSLRYLPHRAVTYTIYNINVNHDNEYHRYCRWISAWSRVDIMCIFGLR